MKNYILVCTSHKAKVCGGGCCSDKGGDELLAKIQERIQSQGLSKFIEAKASACMSNCKQGISVKVLPGREIIGRSNIVKLEAILEEFKSLKTA
ncbi:MAG: (2Fe-2S) ferredoxin domain-containing protein [Bacteroidota bacterium]